MTNEITVVIAAHPARARSGLLSRALQSVLLQTKLPAAVALAVDLNREGAAPTRQRALEAVQTDWVTFLDSDDVMMPQHLERLMAHALETGADLVYPGYETIPPNCNPFPLTHFTNDFDPANPIETTVVTLVRTGLAKQVGFYTLERGEANSGEDFRFLLGCMAKGAIISHLKERTWFWDVGSQGQNTSGLSTKGDARNG